MKTDTGQLVGTVQYMSPEQFGDNPDDLDTRVDVYSLGVVHRCLQKDRAKRYFTAEELAEDVQRYLDGQPVSPAAARPWRQEIQRNPTAITLWATLTSVLGFATFVAAVDSSWRSFIDYAFTAALACATCIPGYFLLRALDPGFRAPLNFDLSWFDGIVITVWLVFGAQIQP